jgi:holin-like protein
MIDGLIRILACQLAGEALQRLCGLPLSGPVIGMALLFAWLAVRGRVPEPLAETSRGLLKHLSLLFVPAGAGVVTYLPLLAEEWLPISVAVIGATLATIAVTALVMRAMEAGATTAARERPIAGAVEQQR